jgi:hypothetical protein
LDKGFPAPDYFEDFIAAQAGNGFDLLEKIERQLPVCLRSENLLETEIGVKFNVFLIHIVLLPLNFLGHKVNTSFPNEQTETSGQLRIANDDNSQFAIDSQAWLHTDFYHAGERKTVRRHSANKKKVVLLESEII